MQISFNNALKKAHLKEKIDKEKFENFLNALEILRKEINIVGAGRTDTGVHAIQMYAF